MTSPASPTAPGLTLFIIEEPSTVTLSVTLIEISPAWVSAEVESAVIPARIKLLPKSPASRLRLRALMVILPPPVPLTSTLEALVKLTSA